MDEIRIENLEIYAGHGVFAEENRTGQPFFVSAVLYTDTYKAGKEDDLHYSTHYGEVCHFMNQFLKEHTYKLIEAAAEQTARQVLLRFPLVKAIDLEIRKPKAPIGLPFETVSVKIHRGWKQAYIALGSNMGDKEGYLNEAVTKLHQNPLIRKVEVSDFIVTKPYGGVEQDDFLNGAAKIETLYTPYELLTFLQELEQEASRERLVHWGPRTLDLDVLFFEDFVSDDKVLTVPHPDMQNRDFVLKPLCQLSPYYMHPVLLKSVKQMLSELKDRA